MTRSPYIDGSSLPSVVLKQAATGRCPHRLPPHAQAAKLPHSNRECEMPRRTPRRTSTTPPLTAGGEALRAVNQCATRNHIAGGLPSASIDLRMIFSGMLLYSGDARDRSRFPSRSPDVKQTKFSSGNVRAHNRSAGPCRNAKAGQITALCVPLS